MLSEIYKKLVEAKNGGNTHAAALLSSLLGVKDAQRWVNHRIEQAILLQKSSLEPEMYTEIIDILDGCSK